MTIAHELLSWRDRLSIPVYLNVEAARYSGITPQTVWNWRRHMPGYERGERLSYLDLIEVAFIAAFRKSGVSLRRIRKARAFVSDRWNSQHPFVQKRWLTEGIHLMIELRELERDTDTDDLVLADEHGQLTWRHLIADRFEQFDYDDRIVAAWHVAGRDSEVIIDPQQRFGTPTVEGLPTWVVKGRWEAHAVNGPVEPLAVIREINEDFGIAEKAVRDGLMFEGIELAA